jgi:hypothetical protein
MSETPITSGTSLTRAGDEVSHTPPLLQAVKRNIFQQGQEQEAEDNVETRVYC